MAGGMIDIRARFSTRSTPSSRASARPIAVGAAHRTPLSSLSSRVGWRRS